jgi:L-lysine 2,3-aminomutase
MTILAPELPSVRPRFAVPSYASWQDALKDAVRDPHELCRLLELPRELAASARKAADEFGLLVPRGYLARIQPGDPDDPLLRQVLPRDEERVDVPGFLADPVGDAAARRGDQAGLLQKYAGRVLLIATGACAVHCRYCFRRHYPYSEVPRSLDAWQPALAEIAADDSLREVILSGGDPLSIVDDTLARLAARLDAIPHLRRLRIHTRLPIMIPQRVTDALVAMLRDSRLTPIVVVHANHANELDGHVASALGRLIDAGIPLLNQAVLLRGVNDSVEAQAALWERLIDLRVMAYYLHQLDRVSGAAHFEVPIDQGRRIIRALRARLPGYAVPHYVQDIPGTSHKSVIE